MKNIDDFNDSSDDESIVQKQPYDGLKSVSNKEIKHDLTSKRLKKIKKEKEILNKSAKPHQFLLKHPAIEGRKKPGATNKSPSNFPAPLATVKDILDAVPSNATEQKNIKTSIVPSFRGLKWSKTINGNDLFFSTRASWIGEYNYSSWAYIMSEVCIKEHTMNFCLKDEELVRKYKNYDLKGAGSYKKDNLKSDNEKLELAANKLKQLFDLADVIKKPFLDWKKIFVGIRDAKILSKLDKESKTKILSLSQILSYIYVNGYEKFKDVLRDLENTINKLENEDKGVSELKKFFKELSLSLEILAGGIPYLSEGQIPRHALLYAFRLKEYRSATELEPVALYSDNLKPKPGKVYLGKVLVTNNPHTLFSEKDKAVFIPDFDVKFGGDLIAKTVIGEKEIQHQGANLQGKVEKSINIKLPKFHHKESPKWYLDKYGLSNDLYLEFQGAFNFLKEQKEHGKLSWIYLETLLLAHLIQTHEIQLFKYCNKMAKDSDKEIIWYDRSDKEISDPFHDKPLRKL